MHYRHSFHAGNFADVFKHTILCGLLQALNRKDKPWFVLDTHAGAGLYDLSADSAGRTGEWIDGIGRFAEAGAATPEPLKTYLALTAQIQNLGEGPGAGRLYPGSPLLAGLLARPGDRLVCCETVPEVGAALRAALENLPDGASWAIHRRDGYEAQALLPPPEKRGLVLVDPPFERADEFTALGDFLIAALGRFAQGTYAVWYPLKKRFDAERFLRRMARELPRPALDISLETGAAAQGQMHGCGMLLVNPPFRFAESLDATLPLLASRLAQGPRATTHCRWIRPE